MYRGGGTKHLPYHGLDLLLQKPKSIVGRGNSQSGNAITSSKIQIRKAVIVFHQRVSTP